MSATQHHYYGRAVPIDGPRATVGTEDIPAYDENVARLTKPEPMTEAEFLGLDDVIAKATEQTEAARVAADMLVTLYRTGITPHPSKFDELRAAVEGWEKAR